MIQYMSSKHSAIPQTLGYLYQVRLALYLLLQERKEDKISIENLDDVSFEYNGNPSELLQVKHHINRQGSLSDSSSDLWTTIGIWSEEANISLLENSELALTLITTAEASEKNIAFKLKPGSNRDPKQAKERLVAIAQSSDNVTLKSCFDVFLGLSDPQRSLLVGRMYVLDLVPNIQEVDSKIKKLLLGIRPEHRTSALEQIEGWWHKKVIEHLMDSYKTSNKNVITKDALEFEIARVADQYGPEVLPIHFRNETPSIPEDAETRVFVEQLNLIGVDVKMIEQAILDYYRAFEQRSRWVRHNLLESDAELTQYEEKLIEEWNIFSWIYKQKLNVLPTEDELKECGINILIHMYNMDHIPIRPKVTEPYVMRGSYHMLADNLNGKHPRIGWHPLFLEKLEKVFTS
jgi:hypothetical protein